MRKMSLRNKNLYKSKFSEGKKHTDGLNLNN